MKKQTDIKDQRIFVLVTKKEKKSVQKHVKSIGKSESEYVGSLIKRDMEGIS